MKNCPNCHSDVEISFELCWNCNYSFTENKIIDIKDVTKGSREIDCLRCNIPLLFSGQFKFHEGARVGVLGSLFEVFLNREKFDLYMCPKCGKVEFYSPLDGADIVSI
jgi:Zn finger protein HypA/HybF involved in hydrogenase expression